MVLKEVPYSMQLVCLFVFSPGVKRLHHWGKWALPTFNSIDHPKAMRESLEVS